MTGSPSQISWAQDIKIRVDEEFNRVKNALLITSAHQTAEGQRDTHEIVALIEARRLEVMAIDDAGYFIVHWQELRTQVSDFLRGTPEYHALRAKRLARASASVK